ncbi:uncharacterized protein ASPGLDRAFT_37892 [Aspergillus glaucus CBS 516.65]|uniref:Protein kinase domain-containing protein n=1 Tax=Aspergillus glaucus CBS 516.65 TaxID=1160497 RepID=A0A1L9VCB0_ASPGL|nr:hypothetical protein ASPGLDRAFT_37892 [Aspergillus glaucus CBS 516.65]OJJ81581.1 hypothetical protein ASPGLDRAFT_37892 [Aspergillus glaucus CBS 516.65]
MNESGYLRKAADKEFYDEVKTVLALQEVGHEPDLLVTSRVPGEPVDRMLSDEQIERIHEQIEFAINHLRSIGIHLDVQENPNCLCYDTEDDKLYLIDLIRVPPKINPADHMWELAIDAWHYEQSAAFSSCREIDYEFPDWAKNSGR